MGLSAGSDLESRGFKQENGNFNSEAFRRNMEAVELALVPSSLLTDTVAPAGCCGTCWLPWLMLAAVAHAGCRGTCWPLEHMPLWLILAAVAHAGHRGSCWLLWLMLATRAHAAVAHAGCRGSCWP